MNYLSSLLLTLSSNFDTLSVSLSFGMKKIHINKTSTLLTAIFTSLGTFISMYLGQILLHFIDPNLSNQFGGTLLSFIGVYFIIEYIRLKKKNNGYDTSHYIGDDSHFKTILEDPIILDVNKSNHIDLLEALILSTALTINNLIIGIGAGIAGISISISVFLNFIVTVLSIYCGNFICSTYLSTLLKKYNNLISGTILIIVGILKFIL